MAKRRRSGAKGATKGVVVSWALHKVRDLIQEFLKDAATLKKQAAEEDDRKFVQGAERILMTMQAARKTLILCPQNQFRQIELKSGAKASGVKFAKIAKKKAARRPR